MSQSSMEKDDMCTGVEDIDLADPQKYRIDSRSEARYNEIMRNPLSGTIDLTEGAEGGEDDCIEKASSVNQRADEVVKKAKRSSTAYSDAQILHTSSLIDNNCVEQMDSRVSEFKYSEFAENILRYLTSKSSGPNIWKSMEDEATLMFKSAGGVTWLYGALDFDIPEEQHRERKKSDNLIDAPLKNPNKVNTVEKEDDDLDKLMDTMMGLILKWERSNKEPLQFWNLVLNPDSFSETIENIYIVSHLVKAKMVYVGIDEDDLPIIKFIPKEQSGSSDTFDSNFPVAVTLDMSQWKTLVETFEITEAMFPTRRHNMEAGRSS